MFGINQISLRIKSTFSALRTTFLSLWFDNGSGAISNPWNDANTWSE